MTSLRTAAPAGFFIGTAVAGAGHLFYGGSNLGIDPFANDVRLREIIAADFNSLTPENQGKWEYAQPERGRFDFADFDAVVDYAEANGQRVRGHTLFWHNQNPQWLLDLFAPGAASDEELRDILREYITKVVGRYAGRIASWDAANEVFNDEAKYRTDRNPWLARFGPTIIADVFRWAHAADPACTLILNDYNIERLNPKSDAYYALCQELLADGVPLGGFGFQGHFTLNSGLGFADDLQANMERFAALGLDVEITELDVRMNVAEDGSPASADDIAKQANWYRRVFAACLAVPRCTGVTLWGVGDAYSWIPSLFPGEGYATLWDDTLAEKPLYAMVRGLLADGRR
ncbi:MAG: endo-1,4-beta-xylanase [Promicromonosporaceae bacterium]|nr:endo-1,4-beta-xylanase [Promicromonosporaceae bacterium]